MPNLELMQKKKNERRSQFVDVSSQIHNISKDLGKLMEGTCMPKIDESDLSLKKLEELNCELLALEKEKVKFEFSFSFRKLSSTMNNKRPGRFLTFLLNYKHRVTALSKCWIT